MPHKPIAIVAAMRTELAPLLRGRRAQQAEGFELFELESAVVVLSGIGRTLAARAAEFVTANYGPDVLVSAGLAGALSQNLKAGDVEYAQEIIDAESGTRYTTAGAGWSVVTATRVCGLNDKQDLWRTFGADVVDMEGAAVAQVAQKHGIRFVAIKAVSDEADFPMPPLTEFVGVDGKVSKARLLAYLAVRPGLWPAVIRLGRNSRVASEHLSRALEHLIVARDQGLGAWDQRSGT